MPSDTSGFPPPGDKKSLEEGDVFTPKFGADGLIPAITVDSEDGAVLMFAYMNAEALRKTLETGEAHYWSRSRNSLWHKGETSGHVQKLVEMITDCDQDAIVLRVQQTRAACHTYRRSCFYRRVETPGGQRLSFIE
ncbi:MAG: phosphoribosyl-AMP cyclohydrolase [Pseudomonadota bacterium]